MRLIFLLLTPMALLMNSCADKPAEPQFPAIPVTYPQTRTDSVVDDYFGTLVEDPYRWLEIDTAAEVEAWVKTQNEVTFGYLSAIPFRDAIRKRYEELYNFPKVGTPIQAGEYLIFTKNDGLQNQAVYYIQKGMDGTPEVFLDPNALSKEGTTAITMIGLSPDDRYIAYSRSDAGSDWSEIRVMEVATKKELPDRLQWVKFSTAEWTNEGFFYSRMPEPAKGSELSGANQFHSVYFHKLGDPQSADKLVYRNERAPLMYHFTTITEDRKWLFLYASTGTDGFETYYMDLQAGSKAFKPLWKGFENKSNIVDHQNGKFIVLTNVDAPNYRLVAIDPAKPAKENWKDVLPQKEDLLTGVSTGGGALFADYLKNATTRIYRYAYDGSGETEIQLPGLGTAGGFAGKKEHTTLYYSYTSFVDPGTVFSYDMASGKSEIFYRPELKFNPDDYQEQQVFYKSKDGTQVSMFVVHRKDLTKNGQNPTYLYGYGGFNVNLTPSFSTSRILLLENGGVFAMPNLRGGGEYGEEWHKAGMLLNKQNVFDDMIAAGEFLISEGYTGKDKLAIAGGSNGGLLVGACINQRPDLFKMAFPAVGVMDMLRYHTFTVGWGWVPEYGSSEDSMHFHNLIKYSPYHNLKKGTAYPATLVTTADHDDRVVPAHSFKYAARLQACHQGENPVLIRIETSAGHGAGKPTSKIIDEQADVWSFFFYNTKSPVRYVAAGK